MRIGALIFMMLWNWTLGNHSVIAQRGTVQARIMNGYTGLIFDQNGAPIISGNQQSYSIDIHDSRTLVLEIAAPARTPLMIQIQPITEILNPSAAPHLPFLLPGKRPSATRASTMNEWQDGKPFHWIPTKTTFNLK